MVPCIFNLLNVRRDDGFRFAELTSRQVYGRHARECAVPLAKRRTTKTNRCTSDLNLPTVGTTFADDSKRALNFGHT